MDHEFKYNPVLLHQDTISNIESLSKISNKDKIENITAKNGKIKIIKDNSGNCSNVFRNNLIDKNDRIKVLNSINKSLADISNSFKSYPFLPSNKLSNIEKAIDIINNVILTDFLNGIEDPKETEMVKSSLKNTFENLQFLHITINEIKRRSSAEWVEMSCPQINDTILKCELMLSQSQFKHLSLKKRMGATPITTAGGASGSYILHSENKTKSVIAKPAQQEHPVDYPGFAEGTNVIRERLAYTMQNLLGIDCGIPPTVITMMSHTIFEKNDPIKKMLGQLSIPLTRQQFIKFTDNGENIDDFVNQFYLYQNTLIESYVSSLPQNSQEEIQAYINGEGEATRAVKEADQLLNFTISKIRASRANPDQIKNLAKKIALDINQCNRSDPCVLSCQLMIKNCTPLLDLNKEEQRLINPKEYEKVLIDLVLFNADRHLGNILVHPVAQEELFARIEEVIPLDRNEFIHLLNEMLIYDKNVFSLANKMLDYLQYINKDPKITEHLEKTISNLIFAIVNKHESVFELVLIDHGNTLPDPAAKDVGCSSLDFALHEWANAGIDPSISITGIAKEKILQLNIPTIVSKIGKEAVQHEKQFGENCHLPPSCLELLTINLLFLKKGVEKDYSLLTMNAFFKTNGLIKKTYEMIQNGQLNWENIESYIDDQLER